MKLIPAKSYVLLFTSHSLAEPNTLYFFLLEYNRLNLVRHGSGTTYELRIKGKILIQLLESIYLLCLVTKEQLKLETRRCNL